jgi:hypothetical protein
MTVASTPAKSNTHRRWWLWLPLLAIALWLTVFGDSPSSTSADVVSATVRPANRTASVAPSASASTKVSTPLETLLPREQLFPKHKTTYKSPDLFMAGSWSPPSVKSLPSTLLPAPPPTAPPLLFAYLGKKIEANVWEVYLSRGEQNFVLREGDTLENTYRIVKIAPPQMSLLYLPLNQTQTISIGESQ